MAPAVVSYDEGRAPTDDSQPSGGMAQRRPGCENCPKVCTLSFRHGASHVNSIYTPCLSWRWRTQIRKAGCGAGGFISPNPLPLCPLLSSSATIRGRHAILREILGSVPARSLRDASSMADDANVRIPCSTFRRSTTLPRALRPTTEASARFPSASSVQKHPSHFAGVISISFNSVWWPAININQRCQ